MDRRSLLQSAALAGGLLALEKPLRGETAKGLVSAGDSRIQQGYLDTDAGQIYYWCAGKGPDVTFIHQSSNSSEEYAGLVPLLADDCRMIAMDLPGHGRSDDPATEPTVDDYTQSVEQVLDHLKVRKTHVVGHHGGALAAMNLASRNPSLVQRSILSGTGGVKSMEDNLKFLEELLKIDITLRSDSDFVAGTWERYIDMMSDGGSVTDIMKPYIAFLGARLRPYRGVVVNLKWDRRPALARLRGPVLLLQGDKDEFVSGQKSLLTHIPNSKRRVLPGCGTFMFYDRPDICEAVIREYLFKA